VGHSGGLRGWRLQRHYVPQGRLSVIVMLNHEGGAAGKISEYIIRKVLSLPEPPRSDIKPPPRWLGSFLDESTQLAVTVSQGKKGEIVVKYHRNPDDLRLVADDRAESVDAKASIEGDTLTIIWVVENRKLVAQRIRQEFVTDGSHLQGTYYCSEMESTFVCQGKNNMLYGAFDGPLGRGPVNLMRRLGENVWTWACPRSLDHTPPGDWTIVFDQSVDGRIRGCTIGCWLARRLVFLKT
jgi:D-aminopeptidase-like protein